MGIDSERVRADSAGRLIIGGVGNLAGPRMAAHRGWARRKLKAVYPALKVLDFEYAWCGRIAMTGDHLPRVVSLGENGVSIYGYSGRGIGPGTVFGQCAAEWAQVGSVDAFPVAPSQTETDRLAPLKAAYYDLGSLAVHLIGVRQ